MKDRKDKKNNEDNKDKEDYTKQSREERRERRRERREERWAGRGIFPGIFLIILGTGFLLQNIFAWFSFNYVWPVLIIAVGLNFILRGRR